MPPGSEATDASDGTGRPNDPEAAIEAIRDRGERIRERELARALSQLDLSEPEREAVTTLSERLVADLLAVPEQRLRTASDPDLVETALALFGEER